MTSILVKALEDLSIEENRPHMISIAKNALSLYSQSKEGKKTKEEILNGYINPVCTCHIMYKSRKKTDPDCEHCNYWDYVLEAMEVYAQQFQSKENEGKQAGVEKEAAMYAQMQWVGYDEEYKFSKQALIDLSICDFIAGAKWASGERGEVERLKGE